MGNEFLLCILGPWDSISNLLSTAKKRRKIGTRSYAIMDKSIDYAGTEEERMQTKDQANWY